MANTNNTKELKTWILTDDDCFQHMKKMSNDNKQWRMVQIYGTPDEKCYSGYVDIDLDDYLNPTEDYEAQIIIDILTGYGYDEFIFGVDFDTEIEHYNLILNNIKEIYGDSYLQIIAECVAEYMMNPDGYIIKPSDATSFEEVKEKIYEFMKGEDD